MLRSFSYGNQFEPPPPRLQTDPAADLAAWRQRVARRRVEVERTSPHVGLQGCRVSCGPGAGGFGAILKRSPDLSLADDEIKEEFDLVEAARGHAVAVARELSRNNDSTSAAS